MYSILWTELVKRAKLDELRRANKKTSDMIITISHIQIKATFTQKSLGTRKLECVEQHRQHVEKGILRTKKKEKKNKSKANTDLLFCTVHWQHYQVKYWYVLCIFASLVKQANRSHCKSAFLDEFWHENSNNK